MKTARIKIKGNQSMYHFNTWTVFIVMATAVLLWAIPDTGQAQGSVGWPDGWETDAVEVEAKWELPDPSVPICYDNTPNSSATYNKIVKAFPHNGKYSTWKKTYTLKFRWDGISRKYEDYYYDNTGRELRNSHHVLRHRIRSTSNPLAANNCPQTLEQAKWRNDWRQIQYKSTPYLFVPVWFREEAGNDCNIWDRQNENLCPNDEIGLVDDIVTGKVPNNRAIVRLREDHPNFDFSTVKAFLKVTQYRYRVEFLNEKSDVVFEMSLDQVIEEPRPVGSRTSSIALELEVVKSPRSVDEVLELFALAAQIQENFGLIPSTRSKGGVEVPARILLAKTGQTTSYAPGDDGDIQAGVPWPSPRFTSTDGSTPLTGNVVFDQLTGLLWARDAGTPTVGACKGGSKTWQEALDYVACLNCMSYLGYSDWRLPNINEIESLLKQRK